MIWPLVVVFATAVCGALVSSSVAADQGLSRDAGFGDDGLVVVADVLAPLGLYDITVQSDGRILVAVAHGTDATFVRRYESDGSIDTTFGVGGDIRMPPMMTAVWLPRDPQQAIFVVLATGMENVFRLRRYESGGSLDSGFGSGGEAEFSHPIGYNGISMVADAFGRVTVASPNRTSETDTTRVHQFEPGGRLDQSFGVGGVSVLDQTRAEVAGVDSLGRILMVAERTHSFLPVVGRLNARGVLDPTFSHDGYASLIGSLDRLTLMVTDDDGVAIVARDVHLREPMSVQRLTATGEPDLAFGTNGTVRVRFLDLQPTVGNTEEYASPYSIVDLGGGRLGVLGDSFSDGVAFVLNSDGSFDDSFGQGGRAVLSTRMDMLAGSMDASGAVVFLGYDELRPILMQRSIPGSPWPPVAPAPQNLVARETTPGTILATWSPVVNPDPEVTESGYYFEITPYPFSFSSRSFTTKRSAALSPLPPGTYTFTVWSENLFTSGLRSSTTVTVSEPPPDQRGSNFTPFTPIRLLDTRPGAPTFDGRSSGAGAVERGTTTMLQVAQRGGIAADAAAVALNVTITEPKSPGFVTVYPCGSARPNASNVNFTPGQTVANAVIAKLAAGTTCIYSSASAHLVVDATGYYEPTTELVALAPARLMDTRDGYSTIDGAHNAEGRRSPGMISELDVRGRGGVGPAPSTVILNVTITDPTAPGFVTVYPCGAAVPTASNANFVAGQTIANAVIAKTGNNGKVCIYTSASTHLVVDVAGYYSSHKEFSSTTPARLLDSRPGTSTVDDRYNGIGVRVGGSETKLDVLGRGGVAANATAVALTVTATESALPGFVTVYPCGSTRPTASGLNFGAQQTIANTVIVQPGPDGNVCLFSNATTHLIVDISGFY